MAGPDSAIGMIAFVLLSFGSNSRDVVSYLNPDDYFIARQVDVRVDNLLSLAAKTPQSGKDQIMQLLAIRKLVANLPEARKDARVRALLAQIASGQKGKDRLGFAEDYARRSLALLDGKQPIGAVMPKNSLRSEAFAWFPKDAVLISGFDLRPVKGVPPAEVSALQKLVRQFTRQSNPEDIYKFIERVGNMRLDRFSFAMAPNPQGPGNRPNGRFYVRITGKMDHWQLVNFLREEAKLAIVKQERSAGRNETITYLRNIDQPPAIAVIGDTELLVAAFMEEKGDHMGVLFEMMDTRAGKRPSVVTGQLASRLKKVHPQTFILAAGDVTKDLGLGPIGAPGVDGKDLMPKGLVLEVTRKLRGLDLVTDLVMANADQAQELTNKANEGIREAIQEIRKETQRKPDVPKEAIDLLTRTLESVKTTAKGSSIIVTVHISNEVMQAVPDLLEKLGAIPGPRQEFKKEFKKEEIKEIKRAPAREKGAALRIPQGPRGRQAGMPALMRRVAESAALASDRRGRLALR